MAIAVAVLSGFLISARGDRNDYQDIPSWVAELKVNTVPRPANKFDATAPKLEQILIPLKWTSTAAPITAKVMSEQRRYRQSRCVRKCEFDKYAESGRRGTTVTFNVTLDKNSDWKITDVGGVDGALPVK